jgi:hypothetical protein
MSKLTAPVGAALANVSLAPHLIAPVVPLSLMVFVIPQLRLPSGRQPSSRP